MIKNKFENLIPGKLYQVPDVEGAEMFLSAGSSEGEDCIVVQRGELVMYIGVVATEFYDYKMSFLYKSDVGYFEFAHDSGWYSELLEYKAYV